MTIDVFHPISNIIFQLIDVGSKVLDVGCGTGRLGERLKTEKKCQVVGVEVNADAAKTAKARLDSVLVANIEELNELPYPKRHFNIIVFADVLEHLRSPDRALTFFKDYLKDEGAIIVSVPNVANWTVRLKLLLGKWDYKRAGLLDKTHLRFFTLRTARRLIESCRYRIVHLTCTSGWSWLDWQVPLRSPANIWKSLLGCNFIFKAVKTEH